MKVVKFGGSSLADEKQFQKVKDIVLSDDQRRYVVVSAPGKRSKEDYKITDLLYLTHSHLKYHVDYTPLFDQIKRRYYEIASKLGICIDLESQFDALENKMKIGIKEAELVSRGEYFSALLMAAYLGYDFVDAKTLIHFNYDGRVNEEKTNKAIEEAAKEHPHMVVPGFYGSYPNGEICLFSRGGSDVTGSYLANGVKADKYENWTDVTGILMADPRIIDNPRKIEEVTYDELRELSYSGASVLHEETIMPLIADNIPVEILNTNAPKEKGTTIKKKADDKTYLITGITGKKSYVSLTFVKSKFSDKASLIMEVLKVFKEHNVPIEHIPTSIDSFSVVVEKKNVESRYYDIIARIKEIDGIISIQEDNDIALLAVVGRNMISKSGTSGRILSVFGKQGINIKLIAQGSEEINIIIGISNIDFEKSIKALYEKFAFEKTEA